MSRKLEIECRCSQRQCNIAREYSQTEYQLQIVHENVTVVLLQKCYGEVIAKVLAVGLGTVTLKIAKSLGVGCSPLVCAYYTLKLQSYNYP